MFNLNFLIISLKKISRATAEPKAYLQTVTKERNYKIVQKKDLKQDPIQSAINGLRTTYTRDNINLWYSSKSPYAPFKIVMGWTCLCSKFYEHSKLTTPKSPIAQGPSDRGSWLFVQIVKRSPVPHWNISVFSLWP